MIIFDLDGTLADCEHRRHFVDPLAPRVDGEDYALSLYSPDLNIEYYNKYANGKRGFFYHNTHKRWKPDWKAFYEACDKDTPIYPVREILWSLDPYKNKIQIWSGRCESVREKTEEWLIDQIFLGNFITMDQIDLKMRPIGDNTPDDQLKERWYDLHNVEHPRDNIEFVFDDRSKVVRMWQRRGIFVFNCNQTGEEF